MTLVDMMKSFYEQCDAVGGDLEKVSALAAKSGTRLNLLRRACRRYFAAHDGKFAESVGLVGVGKISYAERRVEIFLQRVQKKFGLEKLTI